jgi:hypothetical protein
MEIKNVIVADKFFGDIEYVVISNEDGSETSMSKAIYDTLASELPTNPQAGE